jgi:hypothetical protein
MAVQAVLTGDIVNSTRLAAAMEKKLIHSLIDLFAAHKMELFRGDSFQAYIKEPAAALRLALLCRAIAISFSKKEKKIASDVRVSIGIGRVQAPVRTLKTAKGEAFTVSGRQFDAMAKTNRRLVITSNLPLANEGLQVIADYLNAIFEKMTGKQAEVIAELLKGAIQKTLAKKFKKTKSTIHQRMVAGRWPEIEKLLQQYENIVKLVV